LPADDAANSQGFTLVELLITVVITITVAAASVALVSGSLGTMRLNIAGSAIARELRGARMTAASTNRPMRVRFNCPAAGQYRTVELIGTPGAPDARDSDADASRCSETAYPFPAADSNPLTRPNNDGPIRRLPAGVTFGSPQTIEFWPNGSAHISGATNPWPAIPAAGVTMTVTRGSSTKSVRINGVGKVDVR
jgi:type II secretory pathway pseudopilin PulG